MSRYLLLLITLFFLTQHARSQSTDEVADAVLNSLIAGLQSSPDNPLGIDNQFLNDIAALLPDGTYKNTLQRYSRNLGTDPDVSYRQIYFDLNSALDQNPSLLRQPTFQSANQKLQLIFDHAGVLENKLRELNQGQYSFGSFMTDAALMNGLTGLTGGSYEAAMGISLGLELLSSYLEEEAKQQQFYEECKKLSGIGKTAIFAEKDPHLAKAMADAFLGKIDGSMKCGKGRLTPMYRYDFQHGASLFVENGILKFCNPKLGMVKNLCVVTSRNNQSIQPAEGGTSNVLVSENDKYFYLHNSLKNIGCKDCLKGDFIINAETGDIKSTFMQGFSPAAFYPACVSFREDGVMIKYNDFSAYNNHQFFLITLGSKPKGAVYQNLKKTKYLYNIEARRNLKDFIGSSEGDKDGRQQCEFIYEKDNTLCGLYWKNTGNTYWSKLVIADTIGYYNTDLMENQLTGMVIDSRKNMYFVTASGQIGKLNAGEYVLNSPDLTGKIRSALKGRKVAAYNFVNSRTYASKHGSNFSTNIPAHMEALLPRLEMTPDNRHLVYIVKDSLYVINPENTEDVKGFGLSIHPFQSFFTKENGEWMINLSARNDYSFPVMKKYSVDKLARMEIKAPAAPQLKRAADVRTASASGSTADELRKLKQLLDEGVLTQEEFTAEKKKILSGSAPAKEQKNTKEKLSGRIGDFEFMVNGEKFCAKLTEPGTAFVGLYNYPGKEPCFTMNGDIKNNAPGAPIVLLEDKIEEDLKGRSGRTGKFQTHCSSVSDIWWWIETDCNGKTEVTSGDIARNYTLVVEYKTDRPGYPAGSFDRMSLTEYTDGSGKMVILGERYKVK